MLYNIIMSYPKPIKSKAYGAHEYCRDAICKKKFGIFSKKTKEMIVKPTNNPKNMTTENTSEMKIPLDQVQFFFDAPNLKFLSKGSYGSVYRLKAPPKYGEYLKRMVLSKSNYVVGNVDRIPTDGTFSVIKFQKMNKYKSWEREALKREIAVQSQLSRSNITSKFYVAGFLGDICWQITSFIDGETLCKVDITADIFKKIEKVVFKLWKHKIYHADLHCNNLMLTKDGDVVIIDFGRSIVLPDKYAPDSITQFRNIKYQEKVQQYANSIISSRSAHNGNYIGLDLSRNKEIPVYSSNAHALRVFYNKMNASQKKLIKTIL